MLAAVVVLLGLVVLAAYLSPDRQLVAGSARVIDGDSFELEGQDIRIVGIDAPELRQTCLAPTGSYACGEVARKALHDLLSGRHVTCRTSGRDRYGRRLASCEVEGEDIGAALVSRGHAVAFGAYDREEGMARQNKLAVWSGTFERPAEWRKAHGDQRRSGV